MVKHTYSAGGIVIGKNNCVILVQHHGGAWSLPKGHIEQGEDALRAAVREIGEETGLPADCLKMIRLLGEYSRYKIGKISHKEDYREYKTITVFLFQASRTKLVPIDPDVARVRWMHPRRALKRLTHKRDRQFFKKHMRDLIKK